MLLIKLASISLTVLTLSSCTSSLTVTPYIISLKNNQCGKYEITKQDPLTFGFVQNYPLSACDGMFAIPAAQAAQLIRKYNAYQETQ